MLGDTPKCQLFWIYCYNATNKLWNVLTVRHNLKGKRDRKTYEKISEG